MNNKRGFSVPVSIFVICLILACFFVSYFIAQYNGNNSFGKITGMSVGESDIAYSGEDALMPLNLKLQADACTWDNNAESPTKTYGLVYGTDGEAIRCYDAEDCWSYADCMNSSGLPNQWNNTANACISHTANRLTLGGYCYLNVGYGCMVFAGGITGVPNRACAEPDSWPSEGGLCFGGDCYANDIASGVYGWPEYSATFYGYMAGLCSDTIGKDGQICDSDGGLALDGNGVCLGGSCRTEAYVQGISGGILSADSNWDGYILSTQAHDLNNTLTLGCPNGGWTCDSNFQPGNFYGFLKDGYCAHNESNYSQNICANRGHVCLNNDSINGDGLSYNNCSRCNDGSSCEVVTEFLVNESKWGNMDFCVGTCISGICVAENLSTYCVSKNILKVDANYGLGLVGGSVAGWADGRRIGCNTTLFSTNGMLCHSNCASNVCGPANGICIGNADNSGGGCKSTGVAAMKCGDPGAGYGTGVPCNISVVSTLVWGGSEALGCNVTTKGWACDELSGEVNNSLGFNQNGVCAFETWGDSVYLCQNGVDSSGEGVYRISDGVGGYNYYSSCVEHVGEDYAVICDETFKDGSFNQTGFCAEGKCLGKGIASGEYGFALSDVSPDWDDGDELINCADGSARNGMICDSNGGQGATPDSAFSANGICVSSSCKLSGIVSMNCSSDGNISCSNSSEDVSTIVSGCASSAKGWACDSAVNGTGFMQDGLCLGSGTCQTSGVICKNNSNDYNVGCSNCANGNKCDITISNGDFDSNYGVCISGSCLSYSGLVSYEYGTGLGDVGASLDYDEKSECSLGNGTEGMICNTNSNSLSWNGVCDGSNCNTSGIVSLNCSIENNNHNCTSDDIINSGTVGASLKSGCSNGGWACDSSIDGNGFNQNGLCTSAGTCDTSGHVCKHSDAYYNDCASCSINDVCDFRLTTGNFNSSAGTCTDSNSDGIADTCTNGTTVVVRETQAPSGGGGSSSAPVSAVESTSTTTISSCVPEWECSPLSICANGKRSISCEDKKCGEGSKIDVVDCLQECIPDWVCTDWGVCVNGISRRTCSDKNNCQSIASKPSDNLNCLGERPVANAGDISIATADTPVQFDASNSLDIDNSNDELIFSWDFGDGTTQTGIGLEEPTHIYDEPGVYDVGLNVIDLQGLADFNESSILVSPDTECMDSSSGCSPVANAGDISIATADTPVQFDASNSLDIDNSNDELIFSWDFGDGTTQTGIGLEEPTHIYDEPGVYDVVVNISDNLGNNNSDETQIIVKYEGCDRIKGCAPIAYIEPIDNIFVNRVYYFDASGTIDQDTLDNQLLFRWDFGDGAIESGKGLNVVGHKYLNEGDYSASLIVSDGINVDEYSSSFEVLEISEEILEGINESEIQIPVINTNTESGAKAMANELAGLRGSRKLWCTPNFTCSEWSICKYSYKIEEILAGGIYYSGAKERICSDRNRCAEDYNETQFCKSEVILEVNILKICEDPKVVAVDVKTKQPLTYIDLNAWKKQGNLDISFLQGNVFLCPSCGNGIKDIGEEGVDCGGACQPCDGGRKGILKLWYFIISPDFIKWLILWWWIILLIILIIIAYYYWKRSKKKKKVCFKRRVPCD